MSLVIRHTQYHLHGQIYSPLLILLTAISLLLAGTWLAFNQPPRLDPYAPISLADKFLYPLEFNAFQRLPKISGKLNNVFALPGSDLVWAVGDDGLIIHTPDGGKTWNKQTFPENSQYQPVEQSDQQQTQKHSFLDIIIPPSLAAEAPAERKKTLAQKKQGEQQEKSTPTLVDKQDENQKHGKIPVLYSVFFIDAELGWIAGENGTILHTENSGKTWQIQNSGQNTLLRAITFVDNQHGWAVGDTGKILHFDKLGKWREQDSKVGNDLHAVTFLDQK